jgi:hypothetical protein
MWRVLAVFLATVVVVGLAPVRVAARSSATPTAIGQGSSVAAEMLGHLPDLPLGKSGATVIYADLALQALSLGIDEAPGASDDARARLWIEAIRTVTIPQATGQHWSRPEWRDAFGFDLYQVEQAVEYAAPPLGLTIVRGSFDPDELRAAWAAGGYQPIDLDFGEAYAVRADFEVDFADPGSRMALAYMNVVAIADDGTLLFGSSRDIVGQALAAAAGQGPTFAERAEIQPLLRGAPADLVSATLLHGETLQATPDPAGIMLGDESPEEFLARAAAEQTAAQELPPIVSVLLGQTAGIFVSEEAGEESAAMPAVRLVAILATTSPGSADQGAAVIADRLETEDAPADLGDRPWNALFPSVKIRVIPGDAAILVELAPAPGVPPFILQQMVFQRSPGFLAWAW